MPISCFISCLSVRGAACISFSPEFFVQHPKLSWVSKKKRVQHGNSTSPSKMLVITLGSYNWHEKACQLMLVLVITNGCMCMCIYIYISSWWLTYPSEKYEFVSWDDETDVLTKLNGIILEMRDFPDHVWLPGIKPNDISTFLVLKNQSSFLYD